MENENSLKKPENIYSEEENENKEIVEQPQDQKTDQINELIESELNLSESKEQQLDRNIGVLGGGEAIKKQWDTMDQSKKSEISKRIDEYAKDKKAHNKDFKLASVGAGLGIGLTAAGVLGFMFPTALPGGDVMGLSGMDRAELSGLGFAIAGLPIAGIFSVEAIKEKLKSIQSAIAGNREKKNLKKLEQEYQ